MPSREIKFPRKTGKKKKFNYKKKKSRTFLYTENNVNRKNDHSYVSLC